MYKCVLISKPALLTIRDFFVISHQSCQGGSFQTSFLSHHSHLHPLTYQVNHTVYTLTPNISLPFHKHKYSTLHFFFLLEAFRVIKGLS